VLDPGATLPKLESRWGTAGGAPCAMLALGGDWALVDPALVDALVERFEEHPAGRPLVFAHAPPGLAPCLVSREALADMAEAGGPAAMVGAMLAYVPVSPQNDPIAKPVCLSVAPATRDALVRCIPDTPAWRDVLAPLWGRSADEIGACLEASPPRGPTEHITLRVGVGDARAMTTLLRESLDDREAPAVTIEGDGIDALRVPGIGECAAMLAQAGAMIHLRTRLEGGDAPGARALSLCDVVSVDVSAEDGAGRDDAMRALVARAYACGPDGRPARPSPMPRPWVVPRLIKRDETVERVEDFFDRGLLACGAAVIDARPPDEGGRIEPLPPPVNVMRRRAWSDRVLAGEPAGRDGVAGSRPLGAQA
jgi:hypothetical protein